jgi:lipopolysaccharide export system permease protein
MRLTLLQRSLFREMFYLFLLTGGILLTVILISRAVQMRELFLGIELGFVDMATLFGYMTPIFLMIVIPVACMFSVFLTFLRMNNDREFVALKAGGISFSQMTPAPIVFSLLCFALTVWVSLHWLAWGMERFRLTVLEIAGTRARVTMQPGVFNRDFPNLTILARKVDPLSGTLDQVLVDDRSRSGESMLILAPAGRIDTDEANAELLFRLTDGYIYNMRSTGGSVLGFEEYTVRLSLDALFKNLDLGVVKPREMSWNALLSIDLPILMQSEPGRARKVATELHKRWIYPFACIALAVFAMPLAAMFEGLHRQFGLAVALLTFFFYYALLSFGFSTAESGALPPSLSLWLPNALFFMAGVYGLRLANLERAPQIFNLIRHIFKSESARP